MKIIKVRAFLYDELGEGIKDLIIQDFSGWNNTQEELEATFRKEGYLFLADGEYIQKYSIVNN